MTVIDLPRTAEPTPESQDLERLTAMLDDPDYAGFRTEIEQSIAQLRAKTILGA